jgi:hypothetical protein
MVFSAFFFRPMVSKPHVEPVETYARFFLNDSIDYCGDLYAAIATTDGGLT